MLSCEMEHVMILPPPSTTVLQAGGKVGHILNLSHGLHRDTPFENVKHFVKVAKEA